MKNRSILGLACVLSMTCGAFAQNLDVTISPNPAPTGTPITISVRANQAGLFTPGGCLLSSIVSGTPAGPAVVPGFPCTLLPVAIPQCGTTAGPRTFTWSPAASVTPGFYYFVVAYSMGMFGPTTNEYFSVMIDNTVPGPSLTQTSPPTVGTPYQMTLSAPTRPFDLYLAACSVTTNTGFLVAPLFVGLDIDPLFLISIDPAYGAIFINFSSILDPMGMSTLAINLPNIPTLACLPLKVQALVAPGTPVSPPPELSNVLNTFIQ